MPPARFWTWPGPFSDWQVSSRSAPPIHVCARIGSSSRSILDDRHRADRHRRDPGGDEREFAADATGGCPLGDLLDRLLEFDRLAQRGRV